MSRHVYYNPAKVTVEGGISAGGPSGSLILLAASGAVVAFAASWLLANIWLALGITAALAAATVAAAVGVSRLSRALLRVSGRLTVPVGLDRLRPAPIPEPAAIAALVREPLAIEAPKPVLADIAVTAEVQTVKEERQHS